MLNPSIVLYGAKTAKIEDKEVPKPTDPHDVLVRIAFVGVCGSDVSLAFDICISRSPDIGIFHELLTISTPLDAREER